LKIISVCLRAYIKESKLREYSMYILCIVYQHIFVFQYINELNHVSVKDKLRDLLITKFYTDSLFCFLHVYLKNKRQNICLVYAYTSSFFFVSHVSVFYSFHYRYDILSFFTFFCTHVKKNQL
jgi:hypothetical protein